MHHFLRKGWPRGAGRSDIPSPGAGWLGRAQIFGSSCVAWEKQGGIWFPKLLSEGEKWYCSSFGKDFFTCLKLVVFFPDSQLKLSLYMKIGTALRCWVWYTHYIPSYVMNAMLLFHSDPLKTSDSPILSNFECLLLLHNGISKEKWMMVLYNH